MLTISNNSTPSEEHDPTSETEGENVREVHLGIDYGTSTSKLVLRDFAAPGGEVAYVLGKEIDYRFPSTVYCDSTNIYFGEKETAVGLTCYESVKMQVADYVKQSPGRYYYGVPEQFPPDFNPIDFAALTIWWLISAGEHYARNHLSFSNPKIGMTVGIPMSFRADVQLSRAFLQIARIGFELYRVNGAMKGNTIDLLSAKQFLRIATNRVNAGTPLGEEQITDWIRSEAEAAMLWAYRSPSVPAGPYFKVDIGAGTTNASMFRINERAHGGTWTKSDLAFFGAFSGPRGMDAVDADLAHHLGGPSNPLDLRGTEDSLLNTPDALAALRRTFDGIREAFKHAWQGGYLKVSGGNELQNWERASVFIIGGGSLVSSLRRHISRHPDGGGVELPQRDSAVPSDLVLEDGTKPSTTLLPFILVAYGLSNLGLQVPIAEPPDRVEVMSKAPRRSRPSHEEIYGD